MERGSVHMERGSYSYGTGLLLNGSGFSYGTGLHLNKKSIPVTRSYPGVVDKPLMKRIFLPQFLAPISCWILGLWLSFYPTLLSGFALVQGDLGDARFNHYVLEHGFRWISGDPRHASFWDFSFFYPTPLVGSYGDVLLGVAPLYWMLRFAEQSPDTSFQLWQVAVLSLNYLSFYLLLRHLLGYTWWACGCGAFLFAFGSVRTVHFLHPQFLPQFYSVLVLYAAGRLLQTVHSK